ncbi:hypothetical protein QTL86_13980 [Cellulosilyticum sp. ST5]|uniref:DUF7922 domain-containing protein n=1 Tax=Cellulosilyticum sp. ST5 TaxID=3055805 RepID=UPI0039777CF9
MYVNNLISLQENISTYGIDDRKVTGHVTLSSPGMIKCYVQNLKALPSGNRYVFCIFSKNHNEGIKVGKLGTEKETKWIVDEKNILGSGLRLEEIDGVALVAEHEMRGAEAVVVGFSRDRYMLLSMVDSLFPRNEQKSTNQVSPKTVTKQPTGTVEKPKVVVKETMPVEKPKVVVKEPEPEEKVKVIVVKEPVPVEKPKAVVQEPVPVILPVPVVAEKTISIEKIKVVVSQESGPVILPKPKVPMEPGPVILPKPKVPLEPGPVILPCEHKEEYMHKEMPYEHKEEYMHKEMPCEHKEEHMHKEMPCEHKEEHMHKEMPCEHKEEHMHKEMPCEHKEEYMHKEMPCEHKEKYMHKEMPCEHKEEAQQSVCKPICKPICPKPRVEEQEDFILPEGAVVGDLTKETSTEPITKELKRIIDSISKDKRVEEKARELEEQISKMSNIPQSQKLFDKAHIQKTIESRYISQQINIEDMLEEEEEEPGLDTNPKKAIECINEMSEVEGLLDSEALEERDYLLEIDKRLQAIRARMGEAIEKQEIE